ncbi:thioredoxin family protein [Hyperthermus butylicus]|uniref:Universally conserved protein n=1 Tax=Hyperthermus butylicus (strain DSM 5456 / JCM 9403 / PLM1-5) TaxID=415426 RepID=A2BKW3_HYPBU|nr:thioredoxin family protein [Hyperthermus butylicus]ABM80624.1 universally conserved protein [Hyperthermus butylicus DSM 5456]
MTPDAWDEFDSLWDEYVAKAVEAAKRAGVVLARSYDEYRKAICSKPVAVVVFTSPTCPACAAYRPIFYEYARRMSQYRGKVAFVEVDSYSAYEAAMEAGVMATPTTVVYLKCKPVDGFIGLADEETLDEIVRPYITKAVEEGEEDE